jgi:CheY-like chemotaxis protein
MAATVLYVDDDPSDRLIFGVAFQKAAPGVRLCSAVDGEEAVAWLSGQGAYTDRLRFPMPHVLLLDLKLSRKSGFEVLQWIRRRSEVPDLTVLVLTSSRERRDVDLSYALGANGYLPKSVDLHAMRNLVRGVGELAALVERRPVPVA